MPYITRRRRPFTRRRRHLRRRSYRFHRPRRLWIRRPRAGAYYVQRFQHTQPLTIQFTSSSTLYKSILVTYPLRTFIGNTFFDYYRILKAKWAIKPATCINNWNYWGVGWSIVDLDDNTVETNPTSPPWPNNSSRRQFSPWRPHTRYFSPKPKTAAQGSQSAFFPTRNNQWWLNAASIDVDWLGVKACFYSGRGSGANYELIETKTIWVSWKQAI